MSPDPDSGFALVSWCVTNTSSSKRCSQIRSFFSFKQAESSLIRIPIKTHLMRNLLAQRTANIPKVWVSPSSFLFIFEAALSPPSQTPISASLPPPPLTDHSLSSLGNDSLQCQWGAELLSPVINCLSNKNISLRYN